MSFLSDLEITALCTSDTPMINPFIPNLVRHHIQGKEHPVMSYGVSSYGYDIRIGRELRVFTNTRGLWIDPKRPDPKNMELVMAEEDPDTGEVYAYIPPHSYALASTLEYFDMPRDVTAICLGKSTYARSGLIVNVTPLEAGWKGNLVVEFANTTSLPARVYAEEGIAQLLFCKGSACATSYGDRKGKYQGQTGLTLGRV